MGNVYGTMRWMFQYLFFENRRLHQALREHSKKSIQIENMNMCSLLVCVFGLAETDKSTLNALSVTVSLNCRILDFAVGAEKLFQAQHFSQITNPNKNLYVLTVIPRKIQAHTSIAKNYFNTFCAGVPSSGRTIGHQTRTWPDSHLRNS